MSEIGISVALPLDGDGFLRRACPTCGREFKWLHGEHVDVADENVNRYFCPCCGEPAAVDSWWTPQQLGHVRAAVMPEVLRRVQDRLGDALNGVRGLKFRPGSSDDLPMPDVLMEPDDMVIAEPPCHPNEPVKVPEDSTSRIYCLICGIPFAV